VQVPEILQGKALAEEEWAVRAVWDRAVFVSVPAAATVLIINRVYHAMKRSVQNAGYKWSGKKVKEAFIMKICISSSGTDLDSNVDARFGRCPYFIIYDMDNDKFEFLENESRNAMGGAGIQAAQFVVNTGASAIISGAIGPNSFKVFNAANTNIYSGVTGTIREVINKLKNGKLVLTQTPDVQSHFGMGNNS
jgi:predicted Fe-Mo cluster-binding NifX family protein